MIVIYDSNNSGGGWWLSDADWVALHDAGWQLDNHHNGTWSIDPRADGNRYLGALACTARKDFPTDDPYEAERLAIVEWRSIVNQDPDEEGCACCGQPHSFRVPG